MAVYQPSSVVGFHSCDKETGLRILNGREDLLSSNNVWDWLGPGSYFWEQDAVRAFQYANERAMISQKSKVRIKIPFVLGAIIELGNCLNLIEVESLMVLTKTYNKMKEALYLYDETMPVNKNKVRYLDCAVIQYLHGINKIEGQPSYDTIRCAFPEGEEAYPGAMISSRLHIQLCVCNPACIKGFFLPRPLEAFNPNL